MRRAGRVAGLVLALAAAATAAPVDLYVTAGQSNMVGQGAHAEPRHLESHPRIRFRSFTPWSPDTGWQEAFGKLPDDLGRSGVGPWWAFAHAMAAARPGHEVRILRLAVSGSPLKEWIRGGKHFEAGLPLIRDSLGPGVELRGVIWHQGEAGTGLPAGEGPDYAAMFTQMVGDFREVLQKPDLPLVAGSLGESGRGGQVNEALDRLAGTLPRFAVAVTTNRTLSDNVHYDAPSCEALGLEMARQMAALDQLPAPGPGWPFCPPPALPEWAAPAGSRVVPAAADTMLNPRLKGVDLAGAPLLYVQAGPNGRSAFLHFNGLAGPFRRATLVLHARAVPGGRAPQPVPRGGRPRCGTDADRHPGPTRSGCRFRGSHRSVRTAPGGRHAAAARRRLLRPAAAWRRRGESARRHRQPGGPVGAPAGAGVIPMNPSPIHLGVKTDTIHTRYSYDWLFDLMAREGVRFVQLGAFLEIMNIDEAYFPELREKAEARGLRIKSVFTSYRELGGYFYNHPLMEKVARRNHEQLIRAAAAVGADYCGTNPGAVYRDRPQDKDRGIATYLKHMKELQGFARELGLKALTIEPMSCLAEPPSTPEEIRHMMEELNGHHARHPGTTVPVWLCGDISHGVADASKRVIHSNIDLFKFEMPWMAEFHFKNTDAIYNSTFGFSEAERARGIVDLEEIRAICEAQAGVWPVEEMVGYLEIGGPKIGRDYTDIHVGTELEQSLRAIRQVFGAVAV